MEELFTIEEARVWAEKEMPKFIIRNKDKYPIKLNYPDYSKKDYEDGGKFQVKDLIFYVLPYVRVIEPNGKKRKNNFISFCDGKLLVCDSKTFLNAKIKSRI